MNILGGLGIAVITAGLLARSKIQESIFFIIGGVALEAYSIMKHDGVFIAMQLIFIAAACYELRAAKGREKEGVKI